VVSLVDIYSSIAVQDGSGLSPAPPRSKCAFTDEPCREIGSYIHIFAVSYAAFSIASASLADAGLAGHPVLRLPACECAPAIAAEDDRLDRPTSVVHKFNEANNKLA
jgi:hypothetical protein